MTIPVGKPNAATAPRRAVCEYDSHNRLGEIVRRGEVFEARDRRGEIIGTYVSAESAIEAVRRHVAGGTP